MVSVLILTHGGVAEELLKSARVITGKVETFSALSLEWSDTFDVAREKVRRALAQMPSDQGVVVLTDILGGTPFNVAMAFRDPGRIEIVSGVNLPMVVRLGCLLNNNKSLSELTRWIRDKGRSSICCSHELPRADPKRLPCGGKDD